MKPPNTPRWAATVIALITAITALIVAIANNGDQIVKVIHSLSPGQKAAVTRAVATTPNPACNPGKGQGKMGICAPQTSLTPLLGAPRVIHGIKGVDVSSYQGCSNSFSGVSFVITKFNESTGYRDRCAPHNIAVARQKHLPHGGYDFLRPGSSSAAAEAGTFVSMYRSTGASGVAVADVEANSRGLSPASVRKYVCSWVRTVHRSIPRASVIVYTGAWFWNPQVGGTACTSNLWVSAYANSFYVPVGFKSALLWQYSDGRYGPVPHINGWDSDVFLGSRAHFLKVFSGKVIKKPIAKKFKRECRQKVRLDRRAKRRHARTGHWLPPKAGARRAHLKKYLNKHGYRCTRSGKVVKR